MAKVLSQIGRGLGMDTAASRAAAEAKYVKRLGKGAQSHPDAKILAKVNVDAYRGLSGKELKKTIKDFPAGKTDASGDVLRRTVKDELNRRRYRNVVAGSAAVAGGAGVTGAGLHVANKAKEAKALKDSGADLAIYRKGADGKMIDIEKEAMENAKKRIDSWTTAAKNVKGSVFKK